MEWSLFNCDPSGQCNRPLRDLSSSSRKSPGPAWLVPLSSTPLPPVHWLLWCRSHARLYLELLPLNLPCSPSVLISLMKWEGKPSHFPQEFWNWFEWTPSKVAVGRSFLWRAVGKLFRLCGHIITATHSHLPLLSAWAWGVLQECIWGGSELQLKLADPHSRHTVPYH